MPKVLVDAVETHARLRARGRGTARSVLAGLAVMLVGGIAAGGAAAQLPSGTSGSSSLMIVQDEEVFRTLSAYGTCFASRKTEEALALMATVPGTTGEAEVFRERIRRPSIMCVGGNTSVRMPMYMMRGAIAEGLYRRGVPLPANVALPTPPPGTPTRTLAEAARCYAAEHREQVRALIERSRVGSPEEYSLLSEMAPDFFLCLPERARSARVTPVQVRGHLVEALYRMPESHSAPAGQE